MAKSTRKARFYVDLKTLANFAQAALGRLFRIDTRTLARLEPSLLKVRYRRKRQCDF